MPEIDKSSLKDTTRITLKRSDKIHQLLWNQDLNNNKSHQIKPLLKPNLIPLFCTKRTENMIKSEN